MYQPATTTPSQREMALQSLELDRLLGAFDPFTWEHGDPVPLYIEEWLEPGGQVNAYTVLEAWSRFSAKVAGSLNFPNALGTLWLTYSLETLPNGEVIARHLKLSRADGYSLTVSDNSEYAVVVLPGEDEDSVVEEEQTIIPAVGHPLRALLCLCSRRTRSVDVGAHSL